ncbi:MAG: ABC transporter permease [Chloroflexi bacterium]|nr:ABC transporter permease [Chloroflexota bacterium]
MPSLSSQPRPGSWPGSVRKYWSIFTIQLVNSLAYPGELVGRSLMIIPFMWIFAQLWRVTFAASGSTAINGLTLADTLWYLMLAETIELSRPRLSNAIAESVKDGSIAYVLNKPYNFLLYQFSTSMGETVFRALMNAILGSLLVWALIGPPPQPLGFLVAIPAILGAWVLDFCISAIIGLAAFATEDINAFQWIVQKLAFILGGLLIPLDFYPTWLQTIARSLPFSAMVYAPARLFVAPSLPAFLNTLETQLLWIAGIGLLTVLAYRRGVAILTVNGG